MSQEEFRSYEISFLLKDESAVPDLLKLLKKEGAEINFEGALKKITLAYKVRREGQAYFGYFHISVGPERIEHIEKEFKSHPLVLRTLIVTPPFIKAAENSIVRGRREIPEREKKTAAPPKEPLPLSNEEIERKIDEILQ